ncbi:hypothetical protein CVCC1112_2662 [Paenarthrobacter nicotinovorans]|nr:hypothetical protein CVCC1112_2662 [Paenarthrobacter nicotinovorans]
MDFAARSINRFSASSNRRDHDFPAGDRYGNPLLILERR